MPNDWEVKILADCAADTPYATQIGPFGKALMADSYVQEGVPVLRGVNVNRGRFHDDDFVFIDDATAQRLAKFESKPGDVLLVHKGTLGQIGIMPQRRRFSRYIMGNSMLRVQCDSDVLLPEYLYYWLSSPAGQHYLFSRVSQVGVPQLQKPLSTLREARLALPTVPEQRAIVDVLSVLDDKIELNRRMNETLLSIVDAIYQAWFIDFEPIIFKRQGAAAYPGMSNDVFAMLPSKLETREGAEVPDGWTVSSLSGLVDLVGGGTPKRKVPEYWNGDIPWFSVRDAPDDADVWVTKTQEAITDQGLASSSAKVLRTGTTIISARGTVGRLALAAVPMTFNQSCYGVQGRDGIGDYFVYFTLRNAVSELQRRAHGSVFDTITRRTFDTLSTLRPPSYLLDAFEETVAPYLHMILVNRWQDGALVAARDHALPRLLSGAVRLPEDVWRVR